jgi:hypothetical protein
MLKVEKVSQALGLIVGCVRGDQRRQDLRDDRGRNEVESTRIGGNTGERSGVILVHRKAREDTFERQCNHETA